MRHFIIILLLFLVSKNAFAFNPWWTAIDKRLITTITKLDKSKPAEIEQYFKQQRIQAVSIEKENLGFGWTMWTPAIGGGYISIAATFFYYHDSLVSYSLRTQLPKEKGLQQRYRKWYGTYFSYADAAIQPYQFNEAAILRPLKEYPGQVDHVSENISHYMTPYSGTMYGYAGGGVIMQNRRAFLAIRDCLTNDELILLMYSINPASRLTAMEYYLKAQNRVKDDVVYKWIEQNMMELPQTKTMSGCFYETVDTRTLFLPPQSPLATFGKPTAPKAGDSAEKNQRLMRHLQSDNVL
jgi:hypothetical protein